MYRKLGTGLLVGLFLSASLATYAKRATYSDYLCATGLFDCVTIQKGETWDSLFPDYYQQQLVMNLNRINTPLYRGMKIAVPYDLQTLNRLDLAPFPAYRDAEGRKVIIFDPRQLAWGAYDENGNLVNWGAASGGMGWCQDVRRPCRTVVGEFYMIRKQGPECKSSEYPIEKPGAPMPYCMHFYRGYAVHGSPVVPGYHASHGCVRVLIDDARWLNEEFIDLPGKGVKSTKVIVLPYS